MINVKGDSLVIGLSIKQLMDLSEKNAIVTGGAMGIGEGIVRRLHEAGANVVIADLDLVAASKLERELNQTRGDSSVAVRCDVAEPSDVKKTIDCCIEHFGSLNILVNDAGIYPFAKLEDLSEDDFRKILDVNLFGVYNFTKQSSERMIRQGTGGKIITIGSVDSLHPSAVGLAAYDSSKHAVWGFTKNVAIELAEHDIAVNLVAPGGVATPGTSKASGGQAAAGAQASLFSVPMKRMGVPDDIGRVVLFLASGLSSYMTGSIVVVDGGMLLK